MNLFLTNVFILDVTNGLVLRDQAVSVIDGRIETIERTAEPMPGAIDAGGRYLCPGLIDSHVHLFLDGGPSPRLSFLQADESARMQTALQNARIAIRAGITTVRDCGSPAKLIFSLQKMAQERQCLAPRIISCGSPLMRRGGHCHFMGGEVECVEDVYRTIEYHLSAGASFVKLMASGGGLTPGTFPHEADLPLELMRAAAEAAHANDVHVTAHCHATESITRAIDAGLDMIEHAGFLTADGRYRFNDKIARRMSEVGMRVGPTVFGALQMAEGYRSKGIVYNKDDVNPIERWMGRLANVFHFQRHGVRMIGGTDCGCPDTPFDSLVDELLCYIKAGLSNTEALRMATVYAADLLRTDKIGEFRPGYQADMILLDQNPLEDLNALRQPLLVFKGGHLMHTADDFIGLEDGYFARVGECGRISTFDRFSKTEEVR